MNNCNNSNPKVGIGCRCNCPTSLYSKKYLNPYCVNNINVLMQSDLDTPNCKYIIKYNYDLEGKTITIPENCILEFDGGSLSNGTIVGNNTILNYCQSKSDVLNNITTEGTFIYNNPLSADESTLTEEDNIIKVKNKGIKSKHLHDSIVDNEDIYFNVSGKLQFKDRNNTDGFGYVILRKDKSFEEQLDQDNTIYEIRYDFDLDEKTIEIPENGVLKFKGGSLNNGTIVGNNTKIEANIVKIFGENLNLNGSFVAKESYPQWFGIIPDNNTLDVTPVIKKLVAVNLPIFFSSGTWYLSECLLQGVGITLKGVGSHYAGTTSNKLGSVFKAFNPTGQRFILKLGGESNFVPNIPARQSGESDEHYAERKNAYYKSIWCSNFILDGIYFSTRNTTFTNADTDQIMQNYAAVCFDWCVEGYVNIKHTGNCPGVFIANTWEVYFESIVLYGSATSLNESALYFGKCYSDLVSSNISAVTINNLFGEAINGKFIDCHNNCNIADLIINNVEFEPTHGTNNYSHISAAAYDIIEQNVRTMDVQYYFNFVGFWIVINQLTYCGYAVTYNSDTIARGLISIKTDNSHVTVNKLINIATDNIIDIFKAVGYAKLSIDSVQFASYGGIHTSGDNKFRGHTAIYTFVNVLTDLTSINSGLSGKITGTIDIKDAWTIIDKDIVKVYNPGLLFNSNSFGEVCSLSMSNYTSLQIVANIQGSNIPLLYFKNTTLERKFKFNGTKLIFNYTAPNEWDTKNIVISYFNADGTPVTQGEPATPVVDEIKLTKTYTEVLSHEYTIYDGDYAYCTIKFNSAICIESVYVEN